MKPATGPEAQALAQAADSPAYKFFNEHAELPVNLRNKRPPMLGAVRRFIFNKLFPALRLRWVKLDACEVGGRCYYRVKVGVPGRDNSFVVTPIHAFVLAQMLMMYYQVGQLHGIAEIGVVGHESRGDVSIPMWAMPYVMEHLETIITENESQVRFLHAEMRRLAEVEQADQVPVLPEPEAKPTLH